MSDISSTDWSETAASNNQTPPAGWPEGQAPSTVNDCARAMMAALKKDWNNKGATVTSGGTANAQTLSYGVSPTAYVQGQRFAFIAGATNTGATTLAVNSLGTKNVFLFNLALVGGEIQSGELVEVQYDGTQFQIVSNTRVSNKQAWFPTATLTDNSTTVSWDLSLAQVGRLNIANGATGNRFLANPNNVKDGATYIFEPVQNSTGSTTFTYGTNFDFGTAGAPTLTTTANKHDVLTFLGGASSKMRFIGIAKGFAG